MGRPCGRKARGCGSALAATATATATATARGWVLRDRRVSGMEAWFEHVQWFRVACLRLT